MSTRVVGIDLGTTNSVVAVLENGVASVVRNLEGDPTTPSVVAFSRDGSGVVVGKNAKRQSVTNPAGTVRSVKRHMGSAWTFDVAGNRYTPQEVSARILSKLKQDAETYLDAPVDSAVITVPAYFNDAQRQATAEAGRIAGFEVLRIINEPTAAALASGLDRREAQQTILVFDLGGGTLDVSVLTVGNGLVEVLATSGDNRLGGDDWDQALMDHLDRNFHQQHGVHLLGDPVREARLREAAETAKVELSSARSALVSLPYAAPGPDGQPCHLEVTITREQFEDLTYGLLHRCSGPIAQAISDAGLTMPDLDDVLLVGGSTRMPCVGDLVRNLTGKEPSRGANPDEVVAVGAAVQAGVLSGEIRDVLLLDVTPLTLGIETRGGVMSPVVERNTAIPTRASAVFTTAVDGQTVVAINVYQGERTLAADNHRLGTFHLTGLPVAPRGTAQIEVHFDLDANGIVAVSAVDRVTGHAQQMTVSGSSKLSETEIARMIEDARLHAAEDKRRREDAELRNRAETLRNAVERMLAQYREMFEDAQAVTAVQQDILALDEALTVGVRARVIRAHDRLVRSGQALGSSLYRQLAGPSTTPLPSDSGDLLPDALPGGGPGVLPEAAATPPQPSQPVGVALGGADVTR